MLGYNLLQETALSSEIFMICLGWGKCIFKIGVKKWGSRDSKLLTCKNTRLTKNIANSPNLEFLSEQISPTTFLRLTGVQKGSLKTSGLTGIQTFSRIKLNLEKFLGIKRRAYCHKSHRGCSRWLQNRQIIFFSSRPPLFAKYIGINNLHF